VLVLVVFGAYDSYPLFRFLREPNYRLEGQRPNSHLNGKSSMSIRIALWRNIGLEGYEGRYNKVFFFLGMAKNG